MDIFMIVIFAILSFFGGCLCRIQTKTYLNSGSIFCFIWGITGIFSNMGLYGVCLPSGIVNIAMLLGIAVFAIVYSALSRNRKINAQYISEMQCEIKYKIVYIINVLVFIYIIPFFIRALVIIRTEGFMYLRSIAGIESYEMGTTSLSNLILQAFCYPAIIATFTIGCILIFQGNKKSIKIIIISFINLTLYCLTNAARNGFIVLIVIFVVCYVKYYRTQRKENVQVISKKERFLSFLIACICIAILLWISNERSSDGDSIIRTAYLYYFGGPAYLSQLLDNLLNYKINSTLLFGVSSFGFVWNIFALVLNRIGFSIVNSDFIINSTLACRSLTVGSGVKLNAMSTIFFPFLMDWGYLGLIFGPILFAIFSNIIDKKTYWKNSIRWHAIEVYWFYVIYRSVFKWEGVSVGFFFVLFFIALFTKRDE